MPVSKSGPNPQQAQQLAQLNVAKAQLESQIPTDAEFKAIQDALRASAEADRAAQRAQLDGVLKGISDIEAQIAASDSAE